MFFFLNLDLKGGRGSEARQPPFWVRASCCDTNLPPLLSEVKNDPSPSWPVGRAALMAPLRANSSWQVMASVPNMFPPTPEHSTICSRQYMDISHLQWNLNLVRSDVRDFQISQLPILITIFRRFVTGSDESGTDYAAAGSLLAQSRFLIRWGHLVSAP